MANPEMLADILAKLVRVNRALGTSNAANLAADIAVIDALVVVADTAADAMVVNLGTAADTDLTTDIAAIDTVADALP
jgi:hypothetical protein